VVGVRVVMSSGMQGGFQCVGALFLLLGVSAVAPTTPHNLIAERRRQIWAVVCVT
jgi:hypothetical protein